MKIALIKKNNLSTWVSCKSITQNLLDTYKLAFPDDDLQEFHFNKEMSSYEVIQLARQIKDFEADEVSWLDHHPHPAKLIQALNTVYEPAKVQRPFLNFHLFGDFTLFSYDWLKSEPLLKKFKIRFFTASDNQNALVQSFLNRPEQTQVFPFPVQEKNFFFCPSKRKEFRNKYNLTSKTKVILYTGRLSVQKNVIELVRLFASIQHVLTNEDCRLFIAGSMDDLNLPFIGRPGMLGSYFHLWQKELEKHQDLIQKGKIVYLGQQNSAELNQSYCGADLFASFSTHNDEDYGMSVAEATLCGLPLLLSSWGGYPSFTRPYPEHCELVNINMHDSIRPLPDWSMAQKKTIKSLSSLEISADERAQLAGRAAQHFSVEGLVNKLTKSLNSRPSEFIGFNDHFTKFASSFATAPDAPFITIRGGHNELYKKAYSLYTLGVSK